MAEPENDSMYDRVLAQVLSTHRTSGVQVVERRLATELGVSRIPVREALTRLVAEGVLVGGAKGQGVRVRRYGAMEIRQLYEFRAVIESGVVRAVAGAATADDLLKLELICKKMSDLVGQYGARAWADLDRQFHETLADACPNPRLGRTMRSLLRECHYVFYVRSPGHGEASHDAAQATRRMKKVVAEHRTLVRLIRAADADAAANMIDRDLRAAADQAIECLIQGELSSSP